MVVVVAVAGDSEAVEVVAFMAAVAESASAHAESASALAVAAVVAAQDAAWAGGESTA
jgi:hypothetical protein